MIRATFMQQPTLCCLYDAQAGGVAGVAVALLYFFQEKIVSVCVCVCVCVHALCCTCACVPVRTFVRACTCVHFCVRMCLHACRCVPGFGMQIVYSHASLVVHME